MKRMTVGRAHWRVQLVSFPGQHRAGVQHRAWYSHLKKQSMFFPFPTADATAKAGLVSQTTYLSCGIWKPPFP